MANHLSLGSVWEETAAFVRREAGLLLPVAFLGFGVPLILMLFAVPADQAESGHVVYGPWVFWMIPAGLLMMFGSLSVSALALRPGGSVAEALAIAATRMPTGIALVALNMALQIVLALPVALVIGVSGGGAGAGGAPAMLANLAALAVLIWLFVRVMPIWAILAERPIGPIAALREAFRVTRGVYRRLLLVRVVGAVAGVIAMLVLMVPLAALFALVGVLIGPSPIVSILSYVAVGAIFAALAGLWTVYVARLYRRLAGSSSGI